MNVNVPMIEVGIASAAMNVTRRLRMNRKHDERGEEPAEDQVQLDVLERPADEPRLVACRR